MRKVLDQRPLPAAAVVGTSPLGVRPADDSFINGYLKLSKTGTLFQLRSVKVNAIKSIGALLDAYNNSGDNTTIVIPGDIPIGKASPQAAQALARLVAGDC